jgi:hypothetical protein
MTKTGSLLLLLPLFSGCVAEEPYDHGSIANPTAGAMYRLGDGEGAIQCQGGKVSRLCGSGGIAGFVYSDCSNIEFDCVFDGTNVIAIPRIGYKLGQLYRSYGADLKVERCFGDQPSCEVAMIKSKCVDAEICSCRSAAPGQVLTFYYTRTRGVTAFYATADAPAIGVDLNLFHDALPLLTYTLSAEEGFLRKPLALRKASLNLRCKDGGL